MSGGRAVRITHGTPPPDVYSTREAMAGWVRDIAPYGIFTTDRQLVIRDWNPWLVQHSGLRTEAVVGKALTDVFPDIANRGLEQHFARALAGQISVLSTALHRYLLPLPSPARAYNVDHMLQTVRIAPLPAGDEIIGTLAIIEDVTQRECQAATLQRQQEYDRLLSDALSLLIRSSDPLTSAAEIFPRIAGPMRLDVYFHFNLEPDSGELRLVNAAGITPEFRKSVVRVPADRGFFVELVKRRRPAALQHIQANLTPPAEHLRRLGLRSWAGFPLLIGERVLGTLSFGSYARDEITSDEIEFLGRLAQYVAIAIDRAQREQALDEARQDLSRHAGELEVKVAERTERLRETIGQLESFSYTIAHDLRAPIRSLNGFTDILLQDYAEELPDSARDMLERLRRASRRLDALTRDLLRLSRVVREEVELVPVNLDELLDDTIGSTPAFQSSALHVEHPLGTVCAQRTLLQQCIANLLDNGLKFARPGVAARVHVWTTRGAPDGGDAADRRGRVRLWIEDNGIGIAAESVPKIWGVFERVSGNTSIEGTGIGLAIVARAVERMGGTCGVESQEERGSRFWIELAAADA